VHLRRVHAGVAQQARYVHKGPAILLPRRRVHHHVAAAVFERGAEVAPEAGILGCGRKREGGAVQLRFQPARQGVAPEVDVYH
jgi:hypothetical protein